MDTKVAVRHVNKQLRESLKIAVKEKDVENAYRAALAAYFGPSTTSPFNVDGLLECDTVRSLLEFKFQHSLKDKIEQCGVLLQSLFYIKKFEQKGTKLPTTIFIGDENECFCLQSTPLVKYLLKPIDWSLPPSSAANSNPDLIRAMVEDVDILPFVFNIDEKMDFGTVVSQIKSLSEGVILTIKITKENIVEIFNYWRTHVLTDKKLTETIIFETDNCNAKVQTARQCDIFFNCLTDKEGTYLHPRKKNCLVTRGENVGVNANQYRSFFSHFGQKLSPSELEIVVANKDRIIDEVSRRRTGAFFTPTLWVNEAHRMLDESLGKDWRDQYVVWDCASGTNNLTRDFQFKELYCSTLEQGDIDTVNDCGYNRGSTVFQYDFLNDDEVDILGIKVPEGLRKAFESRKKILFLINPPYGTANNLEKGTHKSGIAKTRINRIMLENGIGSSAQQLYAQFLYRILLLEQKYGAGITVAIFSKPALLTAPSFEGLRRVWQKNFTYQNGMLFQASNFADVSGQWGIGFTIWRNGESLSQREYEMSVRAFDLATFSITTISTKNIYSTGNMDAATWVRKPISSNVTIDAPQLGSAVIVKPDGRGTLISGALGYLTNVANSIYKSQEGVFITSSCSSMANGLSIMPENFDRTVALFCARKAVIGNWVNDKDEYLVPAVDYPDYAQWNDDAIVYSLFNNSSQQSALRGIQYKTKKWDIQNSFFFMSNKEMRELADKASFMEMYEDTKSFPNDSYVYTLLQSTKLSDDAKAVLENAIDLIKQSMALRENYSDEHKELHLQSWNAGWAQLKPLFKQHFKVQYDAFVTRYKAFETRMREGVYKFGFLK